MTQGVPTTTTTTFAPVDLHTHSTASDGTQAPAELVAEARQRGLSVLALTDHDTTAGLAEAQAAGAAHRVTVVPGVEFSTDVASGEVHLLGYGIDPQEASFAAATAAFRASREDRATEMFARLRAIGIDVPPHLIPQPAPGASIGRPHVARALIAMGIVASVDEAFARYIGAGQPAYVPRFRLLPEDAVRLVVGAGGLAVLAHPQSAGDYERLLPGLIAAGLRGLEAYYGEYDDATRQELAATAARYDLLATGGSDYHGPNVREGRGLGSVPLATPVWERLRLALRDTAWGRGVDTVSAGALC
jgi:predicted metal-dependent phosphoesterase TrpH